MSATTVCFSIEGEFLTDLSRSLALEGRWRDGLAMLTNGLQGISTDQALSILKASHKLAGVNDLELVEEDRPEVAAEYLETLRWQFAGLWSRPPEGSWRPYAVVVALDADDVSPGSLMPDASGALWATRKEMDQWSELRCLHYADSPRDIVTREKTGPVLWRRVADLPLWMEGTRDAAEALQEFLDGRPGGLEERGAWAPGSDGKVRPPLVPGRRDVDWLDFEVMNSELAAAEKNATLADRLTLQLGLDGKMADAVQSIFGEEDESKPEPDVELSESGYILPGGDFYACQYMHHKHLARRLLKWLHQTEVKDPELEADKRNWLRIQASAFIGVTPVGSGFVISSPKGRPTKMQEKTLASWCIVHELQYPEHLK